MKEIGESRQSEKVVNQKNQEIGKSRKSDKVGNQKKQVNKKVGNLKLGNWKK